MGVDVGGAVTLRHSIAAAASHGVVSLVGLLGGLEATLDVSSVAFRDIRLHGVETGSRATLAELCAWSVRTGFRPVIAATHPFEHAAAAFAQLSRQDAVGKIRLLM